MKTADYWIKKLKLLPHPEGGYYREIYSSGIMVKKMFCLKGKLTTEKFGAGMENAEKPQVIIPAGAIFGAEVAFNNSYTLLSCMVSPGFDFMDFKLFSRRELLGMYPEYSEVIKKLTRE